MEGPFRVGDWLVEPLQNRLVRGEARVKVDPKVMQVLVVLAEHSNEVALKEKIIESGEVNRLFSSELPLASGMTVSPDGRWVLVSLGQPRTSDIMLVEGFR
jgi:hypothetical protein